MREWTAGVAASPDSEPYTPFVLFPNPPWLSGHSRAPLICYLSTAYSAPELCLSHSDSFQRTTLGRPIQLPKNPSVSVQRSLQSCQTWGAAWGNQDCCQVQGDWCWETTSLGKSARYSLCYEARRDLLVFNKRVERLWLSLWWYRRCRAGVVTASP